MMASFSIKISYYAYLTASFWWKNNKQWIVVSSFPRCESVQFLLVRCAKGFKGKVGPAHNMKTYKRVLVQPHTFLTSAIGGSYWLTSCPSHFTPGEKPQYQLKRRLGGPQMWLRHFGKEKNVFPLLGIETWIVQHVLKSLIWLHYRSTEGNLKENIRGIVSLDTPEFRCSMKAFVRSAYTIYYTN